MVAVSLTDLPEDGDGHDVSVASDGVVLLLGPRRLPMRVLALADEVAEENLFKNGHPPSAEERLEVVEGNIVDLYAFGGDTQQQRVIDHD